MRERDVRRPEPKSAAVSAQMSRMPRSSTAPELAVRRILHRRGLRFRVNVSALPGRPDIVLSRARLAVFIDGCFWHRCPSHGVLPKNNREWWDAKLAANRERDARKDEALAQSGWLALHFWEHEDPAEVAARIATLWAERAGAEGPPRLPHPRGILEVTDVKGQET